MRDGYTSHSSSATLGHGTRESRSMVLRPKAPGRRPARAAAVSFGSRPVVLYGFHRLMECVTLAPCAGFGYAIIAHM